MSYLRFASYEYHIVIMFIHWSLHKINKELEKSSTPISALLSVHTVAVDCLCDVNRSIFGISILLNCIMRSIAAVVVIIYVKLFIPVNSNVQKWGSTLAVLCVFIKLLNLFALYFLAYITEKEVNLH